LIQWNYCGVRVKLPLQATAHSLHVIYIQESLLWPRSNFWICEFNTIRNDIAASNERDTGILVRDNLTFLLDLSSITHLSLELQEISLIQNNEQL